MANTTVNDIYETFNGISESEAREFIGKNADKYIRKWKKAKPPVNFAGINWAAIVFGIFWLGYRKLYNIVLMYLGIYFLLDLVQIFTGYEFGTSLSIALSASIGAVANVLYYRQMIKKASSVKKAGFSEERFHQELKKAGGTSWAGVGIAVLMIAVYVGISSLLYGLAGYFSGYTY